MNLENILDIKPKMDLKSVQNILCTNVIPINSNNFHVIKITDIGVSIYFSNNLVKSIVFSASCNICINGIYIGMSQNEVENILKKPQRVWDYYTDLQRWIYDINGFFGVDFNLKENKSFQIIK